MYDKTVTIVNKLKKADSGIGATTDTWKRTVINSAEFHKKVIRTVSGSTVSIGESEIVLIPFGSGYLPYETWKTDTTKGFTMEPGDVIFYHALTETPTSANLTGLKQTYKNCDVRTVEIANNNAIAMVEVKVEGV
jgi:hypothetical protein